MLAPRFGTLASLSLALLLPAGSARAQADRASSGVTPSRFSVEGGVLRSSFSTNKEAAADAGAGFGVTAQLRYTIDRLSLAVGVQRATHDVENNKGDLTHLMYYAEPRMTFPGTLAATNPKLTPYAMGIVGRSKYAVEVGQTDLEGSGWLFGGGGGVLYDLSRATQVDVGLSYARVSFGDADAEGAGELRNSDFAASALAMRVGIVYRFGVSGRR